MKCCHCDKPIETTDADVDALFGRYWHSECATFDNIKAMYQRGNNALIEIQKLERDRIYAKDTPEVHSNF
jgi:hypothetical protein